MYNTPGVYFESADQGRPALGILRTDIAGFVGYAQRGPLLVPVKLSGWRQFVRVFGEPLEMTALAESVRGFFDNGGAACYIVRVADPDKANAASLHLLDANDQPALTITATHGVLIDPTSSQPLIEEGKPARFDSPGVWGNRLAVEILSSTRGATEAVGAQPVDGQTTVVDNLSGLEPGSIVRFIQNGVEATAYRAIASITSYLLQIHWDEPLTGIGLDLSQSFQLETVDFTLRVLLDGQFVERHDNLSLSTIHSRFAETILADASQYVDARVLVTDEEVKSPDRWPVLVQVAPLANGRDGLSSTKKEHFLLALQALAKVDEVSLLAAPDVVLRPEMPSPEPVPPSSPPDCDSLEPLPEGRILGRVTSVDDQGDTVPVAGVTVTPLSLRTPATKTFADGTFVLENLEEGHVSLRLQKEGFHLLETMALARVGATQVADFTLSRFATPPLFDHNDIAEIQAAMYGQGEQGLYRVAILDPPADMLKLQAIQTWRSRFDTPFAALYYPWLLISGATGDVRALPPSGHVAGIIASTDLNQGVHRAPANIEIEGVKALTHVVGDIEQGILNPLGINCLRVLPGRGIRIYGARTLSSDSDWRYLNVRRLVLMIEEAIEDASQWAVFEPNNPLLRQILTYSLNGFLDTLWRAGALTGASADAAYRVKCDVENNPPEVRDAGQIIAEIAVAPTIPFEFIRFRLGRTVEAVAITE